MKNKISNFISCLLIIILVLFIISTGIIIYVTINSESSDVIYEFVGEENISKDDEIETSVREKESNESISEKIKQLFNTTNESQETYNYSAQNSEEKFFYEQLNSYEKKIYNGLQENKNNLRSGTYVINYENTFSNILNKENGSELLGNYYQTAVEAFTHDNSDLFFLNVNKLYLNIETTKRFGSTTYKVYIAPKANENYYADGFSSQEQVEVAMNKIEDTKNKLVSTLSGNKYKDILKIHDYLIDNIEYDQTYNSMGAYSIYGALVKKTAVCEGYAKAYKYLLNSAGIECEILQGTANNSSGNTESHAWNAVYLDNKWYLVDVTWDDPIIIGGGILTKGNRYKYFLKGSDTFKADHREEYQFTEGGKVFSYPEISIYDYK